MMRRSSRLTKLLGILVGLLTLALLGTVIYFRSFTTTGTQQERALLPELPHRETNSAKLGEYYPRHWDSYLKNRREKTEPSKWGGSVNKNKLEQSPHLEYLWKGYGFSKEYLEDRGHIYAMEDVIATGRQPSKSQCLTCKSTLVPGKLEQMGNSFYTLPFSELAAEMKNYPIGCSDCHNTDTMELVITRPALLAALEAQGKQIEDFSRNEMRYLVCAQCHAEYYFSNEGVVTFPWKYGFNPEDQLKYYEELNFVDFTQPDSQIGELKVQHPDSEMYYESVHYDAGVTCSDCHMPYLTEGNVKITSHWWTSPLRHLNEACSVCHRQTPEELTERIFYIQNRVADILQRAGEMNQAVVEKVAAARTMETVNQDLLEEAASLQRQAQWYWDWVGSENSMGFHNPPKAMSALGRSLDLAGKALGKVVDATGGNDNN